MTRALCVFSRGQSLLLERKPAETLIEARDLAARVEHLAAATGPGRVARRIDFERHHIAFLAPGRARLELGAVGHLDGDRVIIGVNTAFHVSSFP